MKPYDKYLKIKNDYPQYEVRFSRGETYTILEDKVIYYDFESLMRNNNVDLFDLLHEIGHLETNTLDMNRYEMEFYATEWAIKHMKDYNIRLPKYRKEEWQDYINEWRAKAIKSRKRNVWSKERCQLNW